MSAFIIAPQLVNSRGRGEKKMEILKNSKAAIEYNPNGTEAMDFFSGRDLTDRYNDTQFFSKTKRGHGKAWAALKAAWNENSSMFDACTVLFTNGIRTHIYCGMD
jgi:hypothetical protein